MYKFLTILLIIVLAAPNPMHAQEVYTKPYADSLTYQYYLKGDWEKLISTGRKTLKQHIDFKWLRQRLGYAYFVKADYYASQQQYEKALAFDKTDSITLTYLYYCGLYTNNESFARYQASKLPASIQKRLNVKSLRLLDFLDVEYNYKINSLTTRSTPGYYRIGINSQPGYRFNLYQAFSTYTQQVDSTGIRQNEYFVLADWSVTSHLSVDIAYHYMASTLVDTYRYMLTTKRMTTVIDSTFIPGHLFYSKVSYRQNRIDLSLSGSILDYDSVRTGQYGIQAGLVFPGRLNIYLKSSLYGMFTPADSRLIFSQSAGAYLFNRIWLEGTVTVGNLKNFSEMNGLYVYNSSDVTTFKTGISMFWYLTKKMTVFGNYTYNLKQYENTDKSITNYHQHSISSGILWKF